jgi:beta-glucanase (GH16 family)
VPPYCAVVFDTQHLGVESPPPRPRGPGAATTIGVLALTVLVGVGAAFVVVVGFWPEPSPTPYAGRATSTPRPAASSGPSSAAGAPVTLDPAVPSTTEAAAAGRWPLVGADEFDGPGVDQARWQPYSGPTDGGAARRSPERLSVAGGVLTVTARGAESGGTAWRTGQTYGRWEVRARTERGTGYRPALLLWPEAEDWPRGGEVDFLDIARPDRSRTDFVVHSGPDDERTGTAVAGDFTGWHNYAVEWMPDHIAGFIDGQQVFRTDDPARIPTRPMHLAIQQDVGPSADGRTPPVDASTPPEVRMQVDWVRIYGR